MQPAEAMEIRGLAGWAARFLQEALRRAGVESMQYPSNLDRFGDPTSFVLEIPGTDVKTR